MGAYFYIATLFVCFFSAELSEAVDEQYMILKFREERCQKLQDATNITNNSSVAAENDLRKYLCDMFPTIIPLPGKGEIFLQQLQYYLTGISGFTLCILGCLGNGLSISVLSNKLYTSSTNIYLLALAVSDIFLLAFAMLLSLHDIFTEAKPDSASIRNFRAYTFPYANAFVNVFQTISIWLVVAFTVDRYIMICHPFQGTKFCNRRRATIVVVCMYIAGLLYNMPLFFEYTTIVTYSNGEKEVINNKSEFGQSHFFLTFVHLWFYLVFIFVLPCLTLAVLNFLLIVTVKRSKTMGRRLSLGTPCNHRNDTTIMLVAVVVVFLVCQMPALISHTVYVSMPNMFTVGESQYIYLHIISEIANFLVILNSAINILLYYVFSPKFRAAFMVKYLKPCLLRSKLVVSALSRQLSGRSNDTATSTELSSKGLTLDMRGRGPHKCSTDMAGQSPDEDFLTIQQNTDISFATKISSDGISLLTSADAQKLSYNVHTSDTDQSSGFIGPTNV